MSALPLLLLGGCATQGHLRNLKTGEKLVFEVTPDTPAAGKVKVHLGPGRELSGTYHTEATSTRGGFEARWAPTTSGHLSATAADGFRLECDFVRSAIVGVGRPHSSVGGIGQCEDSDGVKYMVNF